MPETLDDYLHAQPPTPERPLLGRTVLVVEDSRFASEALRLICQRTGARIRRADSLAAAARHLRAYRPHVAIIDMGLPDGSGTDLVGRLAPGDPRIDAIIATSGDEGMEEAALAAGADVFLAKPVVSVADFTRTVLALLPGDGPPGALAAQAGAVIPDRLALRDDLALAADLLRNDPDPATLDYLGGFLSGLAKCSGDTRVLAAARALARAEAQALAAAFGHISALLGDPQEGKAAV